MARAAYCSQCGQNVYLAADGRCPQGHGGESMTGYYETQEAPSVVVAPPRSKSKVLLVIGLVALLGACGSCALVVAVSSLGSSGDTKVAQPQAQSGAVEASVTGTASEPAVAAVMGKPFQIGNAEVTILKVTAVKQIGGAYSSKKGDYRLVSLSIKNTSKEQFTTDSNNFRLIGSDGSEYSTDSDTAFYLDPKDSLVLESINPGITKTGKMVFNVPASAAIQFVRVMGGLGDTPVDCRVK